MNKPKLCFIISKYNPNSSEHYYHLHELLTYLSQTTEIFLLSESGQQKVLIDGIANYYVQKFTWLPLRLLERLILLLKIYLLGYRKFYCHYADVSTIMASTITQIFGGTTYKWHCVQEHYYQKPIMLKHLPEIITRELPFYLSIRLTDFLITSSLEMKTYYHTQFSIPLNRILVVPNFTNINRFKPSTTNKSRLKQKLNLPPKPTVLFVHHTSKRKGADRLIHLAKIIKVQKYHFIIVAIGEGPLLNFLKSQTKKHHLSQQLILLGSIPNKILPTYYQAADVLIMPSRIEEFARIQLEAMAAKIPIVATKTLATDSLLSSQQKTLVVSQSSYKQIPMLINDLLHDSIRYQQLINIGYRRVQKYSLIKVAKIFKQEIIDS